MGGAFVPTRVDRLPCVPLKEKNSPTEMKIERTSTKNILSFANVFKSMCVLCGLVVGGRATNGGQGTRNGAEPFS